MPREVEPRRSSNVLAPGDTTIRKTPSALALGIQRSYLNRIIRKLDIGPNPRG
jgi:hypothetical protein